MSATLLANLITEIEFWLRLGTFLHEPLKQALLYVLHNSGNDPSYNGLPTDPSDLYQELDQKHRAKLMKLYPKVLQNDQMKLLFPPGKFQTDPSKFDITLIVVLIRNCLNLPPPVNGWNDRNPPVTDQSIAANAIRAREWRNYYHHTEPKDIDQQKFDDKWQEGVDIITNLGYTYDVQALKNACLDPTRLSVQQSSIDALHNKHDNLEMDIKRKYSIMHLLMNFFDMKQKKLAKEVKDNSLVITKIQPLLDQVNSFRENLDDLKSLAAKHELNDNKSIEFVELSSNIQERLSMLQKQQERHAEQISNLEWSVYDQVRPAKLVLPEVFVITSNLIGKAWKHLAALLGVNKSITEQLDGNEALSTEEKMMNCFESKKNNVTWDKLRNNLQRLGRDYIVDVLKAETLLTEGLRNAQLSLKKLYLDELTVHIKEQPFMSHSGKVLNPVLKDKAYVDLAIISGKEMDREWLNIEREYHLRQSHFERTDITMLDIFEENDQFVIARGIAGIGKTTMMEAFVLKWANGNLLTGVNNSPKIDFLFQLSCKDLNTYETFPSASSILSTKYSHIFKQVEIDDLDEIADRVLVIIDGIDELRSIYGLANISSINKYRDRQLVKSVSELLNVKSSFLHGHRTLVAGRPEACSVVVSAFNRKIIVKLIEICGFNSKSVDTYVENFFHEEQRPDLAEQVLSRIKETENLTLMASVPIYLWTICGMFNADVNIKPANTNTHLCFYTCLLFLRNHLKSLPAERSKIYQRDFATFTLKELCEEDNILKLILSLGQLSQLTLKDKKVVFSVSDFKQYDICSNIEDTGLIVKHNYGDFEGMKFQFRHLMLQEYLSALHLLITSENIVTALDSSALSCCLPTLAGLSGIAIQGHDDIIKHLINNLEEMASNNTSVSDRSTNIKDVNISHIIQYLERNLLSFIHNGQAVFNKENRLLLSAIFEYKQDLSEQTITAFSNTAINIIDIIHHHDIRSIVHLVGKLKLKWIHNLSIYNAKDDKLPDNIKDLFKLFFGGDQYRKILRIYQHNYGMTISTSVDSTNHEKSLLIAFRDTSKVEIEGTKHESLISSAVHLCDDLYLDLSRSNSTELTEEQKLWFHLFCKSIFSIVLDCPEKRLKEISLCHAYDELIVVLEPYLLYVEGLDLSHSILSPSTVELIADNVRYGKECRLKSLNIQNSNLTDEHIKQLQLIIPNIVELNLNGNSNLSPLSMNYISNAVHIKDVFALEKLHLSSCNLIDDHVSSLKVVIPYLEQLDIGHNKHLSCMAMAVIADAIMENVNEHERCKLRKLVIDYCDISDYYIEVLKPIIFYLKELSINGNARLSPQSMSFISEVFSPSFTKGEVCRLRKLSIRDSYITERHIKKLRDCIKHLQVLDLSENKLTSACFHIISNFVIEHTEQGNECLMEVLDLFDTAIPEADSKALLTYVRNLRRTKP